MNLGIRAAFGYWVFLLNNDVSPLPNTVEALIHDYQEHTDALGVGCLEIEGKPSANTSVKQVVTWAEGGKNADQPPVIVGGKNRLWFDQGLFQHARARTFESGKTAWVSGGSGLFHRGRLLLLDGFDTGYAPAYWEDIDLAMRGKKHGWCTWFCAQAVVYHQHESSNKHVFTPLQLQEMSWTHADRCVWKNGTFWQKIAHLLWKPYWLAQRTRVKMQLQKN